MPSWEREVIVMVSPVLNVRKSLSPAYSNEGSPGSWSSVAVTFLNWFIPPSSMLLAFP